MAYLDHDLGPESATRAPERPVQRTQASPPLLDLQRLAGNAAVTQAVKSGRFDPDLPIQRIDDPASMEEEEAEVQEEEAAGETGEEAAEAEAEEGAEEEMAAAAPEEATEEEETEE